MNLANYVKQLTGDPKREVTAACACTSLYKRIGSSDHFDMLWNGRTEYLPLGLERDWSVRTHVPCVADCQFDAVEIDNGQVVDVSQKPVSKSAIADEVG